MTDGIEQSFRELIRSRVSADRFDPGRKLDDDEIRELVADAAQAPSSFNIQHWRFVAVRRPEDRARLADAAFGQDPVRLADVTFIVLGDLGGHRRLPEIMEAAVRSGALVEGKAEAWVRMSNAIYSDPQTARDEAVRSASLAAMLLMLAAAARGLASCPLSGFDTERVRREFAIDERYLPVMLLAVGHPAGPVESRMPRLSLGEVLRFDEGSGFDA